MLAREPTNGSQKDTGWTVMMKAKKKKGTEEKEGSVGEEERILNEWGSRTCTISQGEASKLREQGRPGMTGLGSIYLCHRSCGCDGSAVRGYTRQLMEAKSIESLGFKV